MLKEKTHFYVKDMQLTGYFHFPDADREALPVVVMFNGYATEWSFGTQPFIDAFTAAGFATLNFDYRYFGESAGQPRQMVDIPAQLEDCRAAIRHVLGQTWADKGRLVIWGSSLGGGHAISMAAEFPAAALLAQVPHCCSRAAMKRVKMSAIGRGMSMAIADAIGALLHLPVKTIPVVASPDEYGVMNHPDWKKHYLHLARNSKTWVNAIPARSLIRGGDYRPMQVAKNIRCPALIIAARDDSGVPVEAVQETAAYIDNAELFTFPGEHFDVYHGHHFADILKHELTFLSQKVLCS